MATVSAYLTDARRELWARDSFRFIPDRTLLEPAGAVQRGGGPRLVFTGFPSDYSLAFLLGLLELDVELVGIVTSPGAHPAILGHNALSRIADHLRIPLLRLWRVNDEHARQDLASLDADAVVMASFDQIIGARALAIPKHGWMNIHPSLLPRYRGPEPVYWALAEGATETGITLHRAVAKFDAGPVLAQRRVGIDPSDTAGTLTRRLAAAGVMALPEAVSALIADAPGTPLDLEQGSYRSSVGHRRLEDADSAAEAERMVRAGNPNMPAWASPDGESLYVLRATAGDDCADPVLRYPDGCLRLLETITTCGCHHDQPQCPHREGVA